MTDTGTIFANGAGYFYWSLPVHTQNTHLVHFSTEAFQYTHRTQTLFVSVHTQNTDLVHSSTHTKHRPCSFQYTHKTHTLFIPVHTQNTDLVHSSTHTEHRPCSFQLTHREHTPCSFATHEHTKGSPAPGLHSVIHTYLRHTRIHSTLIISKSSWSSASLLRWCSPTSAPAELAVASPLENWVLCFLVMFFSYFWRFSQLGVHIKVL